MCACTCMHNIIVFDFTPYLSVSIDLSLTIRNTVENASFCAYMVILLYTSIFVAWMSRTLPSVAQLIDKINDQ
jgi:hypothetical protein